MNLHIEKIKHHLGNSSFNYDAKVNDSIVGVFGHSGSGKTTLMNIISGIESPQKGRLTFNKTVLFDKKNKVNVPENKRNFGVVFQDNYLFPHMNIEKNLLFSRPYCKNKKLVIPFDRIVSLLEIDHLMGKKPAELSGGERQRVAIGRALLSQPSLLLMDEPFSNLDRKRREQIISYLIKINNRFNIPLMIISHDLEDILKLTSSLLLVNHGKIKAMGKYFDIVNSGKAPDIICAKNYLNIIELYHKDYNVDLDIHSFSIGKYSSDKLLKTNSPKLTKKNLKGQKVRFSIAPDDIALNRDAIAHTSIQNQIKGKVKNILFKKNSCFITVDCGIDLVAEVTTGTLKKMDITRGDNIYCLIKAKAIDTIHVYNS